MILFDLTATQPNGNSTRHGGGKYGEIVLRRIIERKIPVICYYDGHRWLNPDIRNYLQEFNTSIVDVNNTSLENIVKTHHVNVLYSPGPTLRELNFRMCKVCFTLHGIRSIELPFDPFFFKYKGYSFSDVFSQIYGLFFRKRCIKNAENYYRSLIINDNLSLITVSNHSAASLKSYFPYFKNVEIPVFYSPSTSTCFANERLYKKPYFLLVSANRWEKNNLRAIIALDNLFSNGYCENFDVRVTGVTSASHFRYKFRNKSRFIFEGYVNENELEQLYHDAYCLIYPSLNEGFGYPPLEAMKYGVPVISSPLTSISEICSYASIYTNPFDIYEIQNRIIQILDKKNHDDFSIKSLDRYSEVYKKQTEDLDKLVDYIVSLC